MTQTSGTIAQSQVDAARLIREACRIAVLSHVNPDADAIGSITGLMRSFQALGKESVAVLNDVVPDYARFLAGADEIVSTVPDGRFDLFVFADSAGIDRVGDIYLQDPGRFQTAPIVNIDHHRTNPLFGAVNYVDPAASSTSELVYRLLGAMDLPIDPDTATALLFGIVGDTGSFRNGATTPGSLEAASHLLALGANSQLIAFQLFERKTFAAARLWGRVTSDIELDRGRKIVFACVSQRMIEEEGAVSDDTEGIAEYLRGIVEARVVMLLKENPEGDVRVSMRSRPEVDVSIVATALGGGGHRQAAGCTVPGPFASAKALLIETYDRLNPR